MHLKSSKNVQLFSVALLACLHLGSTRAQTDINNETRSAEKPTALFYQSSFQNYQRYFPSGIQSWKQSNDTVKDIGGWRAYAKEITQEKDAKPSTPVQTHGSHE